MSGLLIREVLCLLKKASLVGAFFICAASVLADCPPPGATHEIRVQRVVDGDTVRLSDGRHLRLIGINTPELRPREGSGPEPYAVRAQRRLQELVDAADGRLRIYPAQPERDGYGRVLAHLYDARGNNLESQLLREGLGYFVAFHPATPIADCQQRAERQARDARRALWRQSPVRSVEQLQHGGFTLVRGRISKVDRNRGGVWLEVDRGMVLRIEPSRLAAFPDLHERSWLGRRIEARGWLVERRAGGGRQRWMMNLSDVRMLTRLD